MSNFDEPIDQTDERDVLSSDPVDEGDRDGAALEDANPQRRARERRGSMILLALTVRPDNQPDRWVARATFDEPIRETAIEGAVVAAPNDLPAAVIVARRAIRADFQQIEIMSCRVPGPATVLELRFWGLR